eukprot:TRINITY_DN18740_c0_g1_i1.p1 TRINITY_DN18740_c0_g1~~TRINITY_DN18740_c0_g1_i1.p1  ORF type:complete len:193 (+),score=65.13 TRINITY_DN18740_c0_g1_i1:157-735(+)
MDSHPDGEQCPVSSTYQYRKVMKPLLERKRRARINSCLEELKELMEFVGGQNGERMQRLEKADVLEVTVNHLRNLKAGGRLGTGQTMSCSSSFKGGYSACAREVATFISSPYSGVQQPQAIRIAMGVADGLRNIQNNNQGRDTMEEDAENIQPRASPHISHSLPPSPPSTDSSRSSLSSTTAPLDLTLRLNK